MLYLKRTTDCMQKGSMCVQEGNSTDERCGSIKIVETEEKAGMGGN